MSLTNGLIFSGFLSPSVPRNRRSRDRDEPSMSFFRVLKGALSSALMASFGWLLPDRYKIIYTSLLCGTAGYELRKLKEERDRLLISSKTYVLTEMKNPYGTRMFRIKTPDGNVRFCSLPNRQKDTDIHHQDIHHQDVHPNDTSISDNKDNLPVSIPSFDKHDVKYDDSSRLGQPLLQDHQSDNRQGRLETIPETPLSSSTPPPSPIIAPCSPTHSTNHTNPINQRELDELSLQEYFNSLYFCPDSPQNE